MSESAQNLHDPAQSIWFDISCEIDSDASAASWHAMLARIAEKSAHAQGIP